MLATSSHSTFGKPFATSKRLWAASRFSPCALAQRRIWAEAPPPTEACRRRCNRWSCSPVDPAALPLAPAALPDAPLSEAAPLAGADSSARRNGPSCCTRRALCCTSSKAATGPTWKSSTCSVAPGGVTTRTPVPQSPQGPSSASDSSVSSSVPTEGLPSALSEGVAWADNIVFMNSSLSATFGNKNTALILRRRCFRGAAEADWLGVAPTAGLGLRDPAGTPHLGLGMPEAVAPLAAFGLLPQPSESTAAVDGGGADALARPGMRRRGVAVDDAGMTNTADRGEAASSQAPSAGDEGAVEAEESATDTTVLVSSRGSPAAHGCVTLAAAEAGSPVAATA
mmetsp:Transcript_42495/g.122874  ORF Transcript_42495/g.122874 Transcript_42495/m.122874 type:complete len:340 (-) Transcript_42495:550-1569(-)